MCNTRTSPGGWEVFSLPQLGRKVFEVLHDILCWRQFLGASPRAQGEE
jgi:hypothetical protein